MKIETTVVFDVDDGDQSFGFALHALKAGKRVARKSWGREAWLVLVSPERPMRVISDGSYPVASCIGIKDKWGIVRPGWVPSQDDMLAGDWGIVE